MTTRTEVKEIATRRADSAIATASEPESVSPEPGEDDWIYLAESIGVDRERLDGLEVEDPEGGPGEIAVIFRLNYMKRLKQEFGGSFGP